jgi:hypothetical protein
LEASTTGAHLICSSTSTHLASPMLNFACCLPATTLTSMLLSAKAAEAESRAPISRAWRVLVVMVWVLRVAFRVVITLRRSTLEIAELLRAGGVRNSHARV